MENSAFWTDANTDKPPRNRWLPLEELRPDMVLARPVISTHKRVLDFKLCEGTVLTEGIISQLISRGIECVAVVDPHPLEESEYLALQKRHAERLCLIFDCTDPAKLPAERRALFEAVLKAGPQR